MVCCNICGVNFVRADSLSRHMKGVNPCTPSKKYSQNFAKMDTLSRYMKRANPCTGAKNHASSKPAMGRKAGVNSSNIPAAAAARPIETWPAA